MYQDYLNNRSRYEEEYPNFNLFSTTNDYLKQKGRKKKQKRKNLKQQISNNSARRRYYNAQNKQSFNIIKGHHKKTSNIFKSLLDTTNNILKFTLLASASLFAIQKVLEETEYLEKGEGLISGVGARVGGVAPNKIGKSGLSNGHISEKGIQFLIKEEGLKTEAYQDSKGIWTIGIGHTGLVDGKPIHKGMKITEEKAKELFKKDIQKYENHVNSKVKVPVTQNMFDAMVSYAFNVGSLGPKFVEKINKRDYRGAMQELTTIDTELKGRRSREQVLFGTDITADNKISGEIINPPMKSQDVSVTKSEDFNNLNGVKDITSNGITAKSYDDKSNITSHTKLKSGYNSYYDPTKGEMGTYMGRTITSGIGHRSTDGSSFHRGLDLGYNFEPVKAFCGGVVSFSGVMSGFGNCVIIDDSNGFRHVYGHLNERKVTVGKKVKKGDIIGISGSSGTDKFGKLVMNRFPPHLHYGLWRPGGTSDKSAYVDPRTYTYPLEISDNMQVSASNIKKSQNNDTQLKTINTSTAINNKSSNVSNKSIGTTSINANAKATTPTKYVKVGAVNNNHAQYKGNQNTILNKK